MIFVYLWHIGEFHIINGIGYKYVNIVWLKKICNTIVKLRKVVRFKKNSIFLIKNENIWIDTLYIIYLFRILLSATSKKRIFTEDDSLTMAKFRIHYLFIAIYRSDAFITSFVELQRLRYNHAYIFLRIYYSYKICKLIFIFFFILFFTNTDLYKKKKHNIL